MNLLSWLAGRARYEANELIAPSPRDNVEFRNEPEHDEVCTHGFALPAVTPEPVAPCAVTWGNEAAEVAFYAAMAEANDNRAPEQRP